MADIAELLASSVPHYCERESFGAEPINTLTNLSFWIAAMIGWRRWRTRWSMFAAAAAALLVLVGLCSGLWHWFHALPLLPLDSIPLYAFVLVVAYRGLDLMAGRRFAVAVLCAVVTGAFIAHSLTVGTWLNVASRHGVVLLGLLVALWPMRARAGVAWTWIAAGLALYAAALVAKSLDAAVCSWNPIGLHWVWHTLGGVAGGVSVHGVWKLEAGAARQRS